MRARRSGRRGAIVKLSAYGPSNRHLRLGVARPRMTFRLTDGVQPQGSWRKQVPARFGRCAMTPRPPGRFTGGLVRAVHYRGNTALASARR
jgi:hypothetical protein